MIGSDLFLRHVAAMLADDKRTVMVLDDAGWHGSHDLQVSDNVTLLRLPHYSPELTSVERVWLHLRERHLSHRILDSYTVTDASEPPGIRLGSRPA